MANMLDARELWTAGQVTVAGYHPCQASCAACPDWHPEQHYGRAREEFTAALRDATSHAVALHLSSAA